MPPTRRLRPRRLHHDPFYPPLPRSDITQETVAAWVGKGTLRPPREVRKWLMREYADAVPLYDELMKANSSVVPDDLHQFNVILGAIGFHVETRALKPLHYLRDTLFNGWRDAYQRMEPIKRCAHGRVKDCRECRENAFTEEELRWIGIITHEDPEEDSYWPCLRF
jgi:hypothetical protein